MKKDLTTVLGFLFLIASCIMFAAFIYLSTSGEDAGMFKNYEIAGLAVTGTTLIILPQSKLVEIKVKFWDAVIKRINK
jgi:hypothetical protein